MLLYFLLASFFFWLLYVNFMTLRSRKGKHQVYTALYYLTGIVGIVVVAPGVTTGGALLVSERLSSIRG